MRLSSQIFDVAVVGGGPSGSAAAIHLATGGLRVALLECRLATVSRVGETLPPDIGTRLRALGPSASFRSLALVPISGAGGVWGRPELVIHAAAGDAACCGWVVDRSVFDGALRARASDVGAVVFSGATVRDVRRTHEGFALDVDGAADDGLRQLRARVVVDASGRAAFIAQRLGSVRRRYDNLVGIAQRIHRPGDVAPTLVEAASRGWWCSSAMPNFETMAVFFTDADLITRECVVGPTGWRTLLDGAPRTAARIGDAAPLGSPRAFTAATHVLDRAAGEGWLAVGDAAIGRDPVSGDGIDFALSSAEVAAQTVLRAFAGCRMAWREYSARVSRDAGAFREQQMRRYAIETRWPDAPFWQRRLLHLAAA